MMRNVFALAAFIVIVSYGGKGTDAEPFTMWQNDAEVPSWVTELSREVFNSVDWKKSVVAVGPLKKDPTKMAVAIIASFEQFKSALFVYEFKETGPLRERHLYMVFYQVRSMPFYEWLCVCIGEQGARRGALFLFNHCLDSP